MIALVLAAAVAWTAPDGRTVPQLIAAHVLPDPAVVTGIQNPAVNQANIRSTLCVANWTKTVRPPTSYTDKLRAQLTPPGHKPGDGEGDHAWPIEDGGMPGPVPLSDPAQTTLFLHSFWWQIYADRYGARVKDVLESNLHRRLCAGTITIQKAHDALIPNWLAGYQQFVGPLPK